MVIEMIIPAGDFRPYKKNTLRPATQADIYQMIPIPMKTTKLLKMARKRSKEIIINIKFFSNMSV